MPVRIGASFERTESDAAEPHVPEENAAAMTEFTPESTSVPTASHADAEKHETADSVVLAPTFAEAGGGIVTGVPHVPPVSLTANPSLTFVPTTMQNDTACTHETPAGTSFDESCTPEDQVPAVSVNWSDWLPITPTATQSVASLHEMLAGSGCETDEGDSSEADVGTVPAKSSTKKANDDVDVSYEPIATHAVVVGQLVESSLACGG
jgi:hypothetical protein